MKRFLFPLDRVRRWRAEQASLEELKLEQLAERLRLLAEEKNDMETERANSEREVLGQPFVQAIELQSLDAYGRYARNRIREIENSARETGREADQQRQRVVEARRQAELLENLKAKMFEKWRVLEEREEENLAGDLYLAKWQSRSGLLRTKPRVRKEPE